MAQYQAVDTSYDPGRSFVTESDGSSTGGSSPSSTTRDTKQSARHRDYKPTALRWYYHLILIASFAALIGITEYAIRTLKASSDGLDGLPELSSLEEQEEQRRRALAASRYFDARRITNTTSSTPEISTETTSVGYLTIGKTTSTLVMSTTTTSPNSVPDGGVTINLSDLSQPTTAATPTISSSTETFPEETSTTSQASAYLHLTTTLISSNPTTVTLTESSAYLQIGSTSVTAPPPEYDPSSYLEIGSTSVTATAVGNDPSTSHGIGTLTGLTTALSTEKTAYLHTGSTSLTLSPNDAVGPGTVDPQPGTIDQMTATDQDRVPSTQPNDQVLSTPTPSLTVVLVPQTTTGTSQIITSERTVTNAAGQTALETYESTVAGVMNVFVSTATVSNAASKSHNVIVIAQTTVGSPMATLFEQTTTDQDGRIVVETYQTILPGQTSVSHSTLSANSGKTFVIQPSIVQFTAGGTTTVAGTTFTDSQGHISTSSYTTVLGGTMSSSTIAVLVPTSVASGDTFVTFQEVIATTVGGMTEVLGTTLTDAQGHVTGSSFTTIIGGTPTSLAVWTVMATSAPSGETIITLPTVVPVTNGGTTEVIETTFTDSQGALYTSFYTTVVGGTPTSSTLWTVVATHISASTPIPTPTTASTSDISGGSSSSSTTTATVTVYGITWRQYVLGTFLPTVIAVLISFPVKLIAINARLMQPFHALASVNKATVGSPPDASIFLRFYSWSGSFSFARALKLRQPIIAISDLLTLGAGLLAPLAAEAIAVHTPESCRSNCFGTLVASSIPIRTLEALMSMMMALLLALVILLSLRRWKTGVSCNPWSIAGMASLCLNPSFRKVLNGLPNGIAANIEDSAIAKALAGRTYAFGEFWISLHHETSSREYGVGPIDQDEGATKLLAAAEPVHSDKTPKKINYSTQPFSLLTWWGRCIMLSVFSGVLIILVYYENTSRDTGFERFMDSQSFTVKFFITAVGVLLGYCMETVFRC